ncbi:MAG: four helix bundle protein [Candidatus Omnitrophica bacterium]|nr:four helix bundle protein [Candidatus Omnitrophota bacterium]
MSFYEDLKVYKKAKDMATYFEEIVRHFDRYNKYNLGADIRKLAREILVLIAKANTRRLRIELLGKSIDKLEELKIILNLAKEAKAFNSFKSFEVSTKLVIEVLKQCEGWKEESEFPKR